MAHTVFFSFDMQSSIGIPIRQANSIIKDSAAVYTPRKQINRLLENLAVGPLLALVVLVPCPLVLDELLVLGLGMVKLGE